MRPTSLDPKIAHHLMRRGLTHTAAVLSSAKACYHRARPSRFARAADGVQPRLASGPTPPPFAAAARRDSRWLASNDDTSDFVGWQRCIKLQKLLLVAVPSWNASYSPFTLALSELVLSAACLAEVTDRRQFGHQGPHAIPSVVQLVHGVRGFGLPLVPHVDVAFEVVADIVAHVHFLDVTILAQLAVALACSC